MTDNGVGPDLMTHNIILSAFKSGGQARHAVAYYNHLVLKKVPVDRYSHNIILNCFTKLGRFEDAIGLFHEMRKMSGCEPDVVTFNALLHVYAVTGEITKARETFEMMNGKQHSIQVCLFVYTPEKHK
jgi:pentatricopeptide repeat protein